MSVPLQVLSAALPVQTRAQRQAALSFIYTVVPPIESYLEQRKKWLVPMKWTRRTGTCTCGKSRKKHKLPLCKPPGAELAQRPSAQDPPAEGIERSQDRGSEAGREEIERQQQEGWWELDLSSLCGSSLGQE